MRQLVHSISGEYNLVPFHLWQRQIVPTGVKVCKYFVEDSLKTLLLVFISLKMNRNSENDQFLVEKSKAFS